MLCALVFLLALANAIAAAAPAFWAMLLSRVLVGIVIGGFWSIGAGLADRLVPERSVRRATAVIFSAVPLGSVLGVPLGTLIGDLAGWRVSFVALGLLSTAVLAALAVLLPPLPARRRPTRLNVLRGMLGDTGTRLALLTTVLIVLAHFGTYTYVTPFLERVTHASSGMITLFLLAYGVAGIAGNFLAGTAAARRPRATFAIAAGLIAVATLALPLLGRWEPGALALLIIWGAGYGAVPVCSQTWFVKSAPHAPEAANVLFTASFQATFSTGALVGGVLVDGTSLPAVMLLGGAAACLMVMVAAASPKAAAWGGPQPDRSTTAVGGARQNG